MNKKGWTLVGELFVFLIVVIGLIYAVYGFGVLGLMKEDNKITPGIKPELIISGKTVSYDAVESNLIDASKKYVFDKYNNNFSGEVIIVRINTLVESGYTSTIRDNRNKKCSGYVKIYKDNYSLSYSPYLRCSTYTSIGYEKDYDW